MAGEDKELAWRGQPMARHRACDNAHGVEKGRDRRSTGRPRFPSLQPPQPMRGRLRRESASLRVVALFDVPDRPEATEGAPPVNGVAVTAWRVARDRNRPPFFECDRKREERTLKN